MPAKIMGWPVDEFAVEDVVVSKDGGVTILMLGINEADKTMDAEVTAVSEFWSKNQERNGSKGFFVHQRLLFVPGRPGSWIIGDQMLPWFILSVYQDGSKVFDHYR